MAQFAFSSISSHAFVQISIHLNNRLQFRQNFWDENFWWISRKKAKSSYRREHESEWTKTQHVIEYKHIFIDGNNTFVLMLIMKTLLLRKYMKFPKNSKHSKSILICRNVLSSFVNNRSMILSGYQVKL